MSSTAKTKPIITLEQAAKFAPIVSFHQFEKFFPCSIDWLLPHTTLFNKDKSMRIDGPSQQVLARYPERDNYLSINANAYAGEPLENGKVVAPMYVTAQEWDDCIAITYIMLYAYQGGQTCRSLLPNFHFNAIVNDYGRHQGDLEWITVLVSKDFKTVQHVGYEAHGDISYYALTDTMPEQYHPRVRAALNGHSCRNPAGKGPNDWIYTYQVPGAVGIVDIITAEGHTWSPHTNPERMLKIIGLDDQGEPVNDEVWAKFAGKLGNELQNDFVSAFDVSGSSLDSKEQAAVASIIAAAKIAGQIPDDLKVGHGPDGPGARDFVTGLHREGPFLWKFDISNTHFDTSAAPCILTFQNQFHIFYRDGGRNNGVMHISYKDGKWQGGQHIHPDVTTSDAPCAVAFQDRLHLFVRDSRGDGLLHFISNEKGETFHGATPFHIGNLRVNGRPSAAVLDGKLCVAFRDGGRNGNGIMWADYHPEQPEAQRWTSGYSDFDTSSSPCIVAFNKKWHVFYKDGGNNNGLMHIQRAPAGKWEKADPFHPEFKISAGPGAVVIGNQLHVFFRDDGHTNDIRHIISGDGSHFHTPQPNWSTGLLAADLPSAAVLGNTLRVVGRDATGNAIMCATANLPRQ